MHIARVGGIKLGKVVQILWPKMHAPSHPEVSGLAFWCCREARHFQGQFLLMKVRVLVQIPNAPQDAPDRATVYHIPVLSELLTSALPQGSAEGALQVMRHVANVSCSTNVIKFTTSVVGLISNNDEMAYPEEIKNLETWCQDNNLLLNISKTKELIVDFSTKQGRNYQPLIINGTPVEKVDSFQYLGVHITQDLSWSCHINTLVKKARQHLYHLRRLKDFKLPSKVLKTFYTCTIEIILMGSITAWFGNSTKQNRQSLQRVVRSAECTIHAELPDLETIYSKWFWTKARKIMKDLSQPINRLFSLLRSGHLEGKHRENEDELLPAGHLGTQLEHIKPGLSRRSSGLP
ncbi:hypothetical protein QTP70_004934 [Hemibagrus guttatus]|uniref:Alkylated DNA repair protein AlkB homologue 8 N-terminal domain-containing protein n=1 Tax=Hemibagrus guttatus TaxID=175788 RepID=A0AAE0PYF4_9TELE|nr:hypothetical protein QTP70_004934 [Hemibagrus guttatus]